jgi:hypothetical protein
MLWQLRVMTAGGNSDQPPGGQEPAAASANFSFGGGSSFNDGTTQTAQLQAAFQLASANWRAQLTLRPVPVCWGRPGQFPCPLHGAEDPLKRAAFVQPRLYDCLMVTQITLKTRSRPFLGHGASDLAALTGAKLTFASGSFGDSMALTSKASGPLPVDKVPSPAA